MKKLNVQNGISSSWRRRQTLEKDFETRSMDIIGRPSLVTPTSHLFDI